MDIYSMLLFLFGIVYSSCQDNAHCDTVKNVVNNDLQNCSNGDFIDCSSKQLHHVPLIFPENVQRIYLNKNMIHTIKSCAFSELNKLVSIDLSKNKIQVIEKRSFFKLPKLNTLHLRTNYLTTKSIANEAFINIPLFEVLYIAGNKIWYSETVLDNNTMKAMQNLTEIEFDFYDTFRITDLTKSLKNLNSISIIANKRFDLTNDTFKGITQNITKVSLLISNIDTGSLCYFRNLSSLTILVFAYNSIIHKIFDSLWCIRNQHINTLKINGNPPDNSFILNEDHFKYIRTMCLKELDLSKNYIRDINKTAFSFFAWKAKCLEILDLSNNHLTGRINWYGGLFNFKRLRIVRFSHFENYQGYHIQHSCTKVSCNQDKTFDIRIPQKLEEMYAKYIVADDVLPSVNIKGGSNLKVLDLSYLTFCVCNNSMVTGIENLEYLDTSGWRFFGRSENILSKMPRLQTYISKNSSMGNSFLSNELFRNNINLQHLDLSGNKISLIPDKIFSPLNNSLIELNLSGNNLTEFSLEPEQLLHLKSIDMSENQIKEINANGRTRIDNTQNVKIYLRKNPFQCICSTIPFIKWASKSKIHDFEQLNCRTAKGHSVRLSDFKKNINKFEKQCISETWLIIVSCISAVICIIIFTLMICFKYRYWFQYWRLKWRMKWNDYMEMTEECTYEFHAFISHSHTDLNGILPIFNALEDKGYKICLDAKDFIPGAEIAENVVRAINNSRRIIFIITENFLRSSWGTFEVEMARMHAFRANRENMVVVIIKEDIPLVNLPKALKNIWYKVTCIKWPKDLNDGDIFYDQLYLALS